MGLLAGLKSLADLVTSLHKTLNEIAEILREEYPDWSQDQVRDAAKAIFHKTALAWIEMTRHHPDWSPDQINAEVMSRLQKELEEAL